MIMEWDELLDKVKTVYSDNEKQLETTFMLYQGQAEGVVDLYDISPAYDLILEEDYDSEYMLSAFSLYLENLILNFPQKEKRPFIHLFIECPKDLQREVAEKLTTEYKLENERLFEYFSPLENGQIFQGMDITFI